MFNKKQKYYSIHVFQKYTRFPVLIYAKTEQESDFIKVFLTEERSALFNVVDFVNWSKAHGFDYHIIFPSFFKLITNRYDLLSCIVIYYFIKFH